ILSTCSLCSCASIAQSTSIPFALAFASNSIRYSSRLDNTSSLILDAASRSSSHSGTAREATSRFSRTNHNVSSCHFDRGLSSRNFSAAEGCVEVLRCWGVEVATVEGSEYNLFLHPIRGGDKPAYRSDEHQRLVLFHRDLLEKHKKRRHDGHAERYERDEH